MTKGRNGESCAEAIRASLKPGECLTFDELFQRVRRRGSWTDSTLYLHLMALVVNLPPARLPWPNLEPFLLVKEDGTYMLYDPKVHPKTCDPLLHRQAR